MKNDAIFNRFIADETICDKGVLNQIINALDDDTADALLKWYNSIDYKNSLVADSGVSTILIESDIAKTPIALEAKDGLYERVHKQPYTPREFHKNESADQLLNWYKDTKSKKIAYARKDLRKRFDYFSFEEQNRIIETFLQRGNAIDTVYCCRLIRYSVFWQDYYLPFIETFFIKSLSTNPANAYTAVRLIVKHSSMDFIISRIKDLDTPDLKEDLRIVLQVLLTGCERHPREILKNVVLRPDEYAYVMAKKGLMISKEEATEALNAVLKLGGSYLYKNKNKLKAIIWAVSQMGYIEELFDFGIKLEKRTLSKAKRRKETEVEINPLPEIDNAADYVMYMLDDNAPY